MTKKQKQGTLRDGLRYPFGDEVPDPSDWIKVAPGIFWVRVALPLDLDHINVWLLEDGDGWTLIDTGFNAEETRETWEHLFEEKLQGKPLTRVICTHMHPDHVGLAGWLTRKFDVDLCMSRAEYLMCRVLVADTGRPVPDVATNFYRAAGFHQKAIDDYRQKFGMFGQFVSAIPNSYFLLKEGQVLKIGGQEWKVVVGQGHSPEHVCLYCADLKVLISGDQVLPRISSNVSLFPTEENNDPLSDWLASCARLQVVLPDDLLVLPAHNLPFYGLHTRLAKLIEMHEEGLSQLLDILDEPKRAVDVFKALFKRPIDENAFMMATGESLAHLRCLESRNLASRKRDDKGVDWYSRV